MSANKRLTDSGPSTTSSLWALSVAFTVSFVSLVIGPEPALGVAFLTSIMAWRYLKWRYRPFGYLSEPREGPEHLTVAISDAIGDRRELSILDLGHGLDFTLHPQMVVIAAQEFVAVVVLFADRVDDEPAVRGQALQGLYDRFPDWSRINNRVDEFRRSVGRVTCPGGAKPYGKLSRGWIACKDGDWRVRESVPGQLQHDVSRPAESCLTEPCRDNVSTVSANASSLAC